MSATPQLDAGPPKAAPSAFRLLLLALLPGLLLLGFIGLWAVQRRGASLQESSQEAKALAARPPAPGAAEAYLEGMARMQQYRWDEAVPFFLKAQALDASFALPPLRRTVALYFLGNSTDVVRAMQDAIRLSAGAPDAIRLRVEPHAFWSQNQWEKCAAAARALRDREPDNFEALYPSLLLTGCVPAPESLAVMSRARASASPVTKDARFDLMEARLAFTEHEDRRAQEALDRAEPKLQGPDNRFLRAAAQRQRSLLAARDGRFDAALQLLGLAEKTYVEGGHAFEAARVAGERAQVLEAKREFLAAAVEFERQLTLLETFGATYSAVQATESGAADYLAAGEPLRAQALVQRVKGYPERILQNDAEVYASFGRVALERGDVAGAVAMVEPALKNLSKDASAAGPVLLAASVEREQDRPAAARERLEAATAVAAQDEVQALLAALLLDLHDASGAKKVIDQLSAEPLGRAHAARLRARSLREAGQAGAATAAATQGVEAARATRQVPVLQSAQLELARAQLAAGGAAQASALLAELHAQAEEHGAGRLLLEVKLAEVQALPHGSERAQRARALATEAKGAGFLRLARLAEAASAH
ncbi:MAG: hypothetical protein ACLQIH_17905 [Myxococcaceae bacterium]